MENRRKHLTYDERLIIEQGLGKEIHLKELVANLPKPHLQLQRK